MAQQGLRNCRLISIRGSQFFSPTQVAGSEDDTSGKPSSGTEPISSTEPSDGDWIVVEPIAEGVILKGSLLKSDPGDNMTYEAASGLYDLVLKTSWSRHGLQRERADVYHLRGCNGHRR